MTAQLLTALLGTASAKSGMGAVLSKTMGTKEDGASFADLLDQQADALDPQLLELLQSLALDPQAQRTLLTQLKEVAVDPDQLNKLMQQLKNIDDPKQVVAALRQAQLADKSHQTTPQTQAHTAPSTFIEKNSKEASAFINSTLFIASESKAMRADTEPRLHIDKEIKNNTALRFDLQTETAASKIKTAAAANSASAFQAALSVASEAGKTITPSSSVSAELAALNLTASQSAPTSTLHSAPFAPTYSAQIATPIHQPAQWGTDFGRVMVQLSQQAGQTSSAGLQTAEIRLDPPELGPLRIVISVQDSVANAMIFAAHAHTRATVEQSIPQLQQQLAQAGLTLGEANVSDQHFFSQNEHQADQNQTESNKTFSIEGAGHNLDPDNLLSANTEPKSGALNAIIDTFA